MLAIGSAPAVLWDGGDDLGESILWDDRAGMLVWVDIHEREIWSWDPFSGVAPVSVTLGSRIGAIGLREQGGLVLGLERGFALLDEGANVPRDFVELTDMPATVRLNDGRVDPFGRFVCGGIDEGSPQQHIASLYVYSGGDEVSTLLSDEIACINALCWSPDGATMYYADMPTGRIEAFDYAKAGLSNRRDFTNLRADPGLADGSCVDAEGFVWNAQWGGNRLVRYAPDGAVDRVVPVPVTNPTCLCFGGPDLDILFVTSARFTLTDEQLVQEPEAGTILAFRPGVSGLPEHRFKG